MSISIYTLWTFPCIPNARRLLGLDLTTVCMCTYVCANVVKILYLAGSSTYINMAHPFGLRKKALKICSIIFRQVLKEVDEVLIGKKSQESVVVALCMYTHTHTHTHTFTVYFTVSAVFYADNPLGFFSTSSSGFSYSKHSRVFQAEYFCRCAVQLLPFKRT